MMSSSEDENSATADRVEKKSIDEAIASFAMLVRILNVSLFYACSSCAFMCEREERRIRQPFFCFFFVYFFFFFA